MHRLQPLTYRGTWRRRRVTKKCREGQQQRSCSKHAARRLAVQ